MPKQPNILMISMDTLRYDAVGACGNPLARTPNIDALTAAGTLCSRAYCTHPHCMPSRASMMTGRHCSCHGVWQNGVALSENETTLPAVLGEADYVTALFGKAHFRPWRRAFNDPTQYAEHPGGEPYYGFQQTQVVDHSEDDAFCEWVRREYPDWADLAIHPYKDRPDDTTMAWKSTLPAEATKTHFISEATIEAIRSRDANRPFYFWASFVDPHHPLAPPAPYGDWYDDVDFPPPPAVDGPWDNLPTHYAQWREMVTQPGRVQAQWQTIRRMYQGKVSHVDAEIGRILAMLDAEGLADNTIVLMLSDHGAMLGDYGLMAVGCYSSEAVVHVPMIWRAPGIAAGATRSELISVADVMPTMLDTLGLDAPAGMQGRSLRALLTDGTPDRPWRDQLVIEQRMNEDPGEPAGFKTLITDRYKLSLYSDPREGELYDLQDDPRELNNLYGRQEAAAVQTKLTGRFARALLFDDDPLPERTAPW